MDKLIIFLTCDDDLLMAFQNFLSKGNAVKVIADDYLPSSFDRDFKRDAFDSLPPDQKSKRIRSSIAREMETKGTEIYIIDLNKVSSNAVAHWTYNAKTKEGWRLLAPTMTGFGFSNNKLFFKIDTKDFLLIEERWKKSEPKLEVIGNGTTADEIVAEFIAAVRKDPPVILLRYTSEALGDMAIFERILKVDEFTVLSYQESSVEVREPVVTLNGKALPSDKNGGSVFKLILKKNWKELRRRVTG